MTQHKVDVTINIFARPYQTALSILSLLKYSDKNIDKIYLQFEPMSSSYDSVSPYIMSDYLGERAIVYQPEEWLAVKNFVPARADDFFYRMAIRYQHAFEHTDKKYLFFMHNDVLVTRDIIGAMLDEIDGAFAIGPVGQCWNCPAHNAEVMDECGFDEVCGPGRYWDFRPDFATLRRLYDTANRLDVPVRPYLQDFPANYHEDSGWPLPECRVSEWGCIVDIEQARPLTVPHGPARPFGAFVLWGTRSLDTSVGWFRDFTRMGFKAKHFPLDKYLKHTVGAHRMTRALHREAEVYAENILAKAFPDFVEWCRKEKNGLFG